MNKRVLISCLIVVLVFILLLSIFVSQVATTTGTTSDKQGPSLSEKELTLVNKKLEDIKFYVRIMDTYKKLEIISIELQDYLSSKLDLAFYKTANVNRQMLDVQSTHIKEMIEENRQIQIEINKLINEAKERKIDISDMESIINTQASSLLDYQQSTYAFDTYNNSKSAEALKSQTEYQRDALVKGHEVYRLSKAGYSKYYNLTQQK